MYKHKREYKTRTESIFKRAIRNFINENKIVIVIFKTQRQVD